MKLKKGSAAAKAFMAKIRSKKGITKKVGAVSKIKKLSKAKEARLNYLQNREDNDNLTPLQNKEYNKLVLEYRKTDDYKNAQKISGWKKGNTRIIEKGEKPFKTKKNVRVERLDNGTFDNFKTLTKYGTQLHLLSGYTSQKEIIIGKVSTEKKLKDLAPQVKLKITRGKAVDNIIITSSQKSVEVFKKYITKNMIETQEFFAIMYLNNANKCLGVYLVGQGGFTAVVSERRLIMSGALLIGCTGFIMCHNHPSGNLTPSQADKNFTKQIVNLAQEHDIRVMDHVIITKESYFSFADNGLL
jgi:DNA repair protein RadC